MRVRLMYPDRDFNVRQNSPWNEHAVMQDLQLELLLRVMCGSDEFLHSVAQKALLLAMLNDQETILYRQGILRDCLKNQAVVTELYNLAVEAIARSRKDWWGLSSQSPSSLLYSSNELIGSFVGVLRKLWEIGEIHEAEFDSEGFKQLFAMFTTELNDEYLSEVQCHVGELRFDRGVLISAELGETNESTRYVLRKPPNNQQSWFERTFRRGPRAFTYQLDPRDEAGGRILSEMRHRGIARVAIALGESSDHVVNFFAALRTELAFYIGCLNLHNWVKGKRLHLAFPEALSAGTRKHNFSELYDLCLAIGSEQPLVGNTINADGKRFVVITGANQGGKSTFLRSIGLAQMMMQCGMFVPAQRFSAAICPALITHFKREEDATMQSGKLDEELSRLSEIADHVRPDSLLLFNESFAATNDREGSEIARQITSALHENGSRIFYVTHLREFARGLYTSGTHDSLFLRAERNEDGTRTFRLIEGEPLDTSFGVDLYRTVFAARSDSL